MLPEAHRLVLKLKRLEGFQVVANSGAKMKFFASTEEQTSRFCSWHSLYGGKKNVVQEFVFAFCKRMTLQG